MSYSPYAPPQPGPYIAATSPGSGAPLFAATMLAPCLLSVVSVVAIGLIMRDLAARQVACAEKLGLSSRP
jgi:hypothetical protein